MLEQPVTEVNPKSNLEEEEEYTTGHIYEMAYCHFRGLKPTKVEHDNDRVNQTRITFRGIGAKEIGRTFWTSAEKKYADSYKIVKSIAHKDIR
jgi:hypothetical protein